MPPDPTSCCGLTLTTLTHPLPTPVSFYAAVDDYPLLNVDAHDHLTTFIAKHISTDAVAFSNAHFGTGIGTIYLDNVGCTGRETRLIDCSRSSSVHCSYGHSEDAGARCQG